MEGVGNEGVPLVVSKSNSNSNATIKANEEKEQFCTCVTAYKLNMFRLAKSILHNDTDAEDATSEAILKAYNNLKYLKSFASFKPWILKIVINESYSLANQRKKVMLLEDLEVSEENVVKDTGELWSVVKTLDQEFRTITILFYYEDMSIKDISKTLDLPAGTVKSRLARARQKLKVLLADEGSIK